jgi:ankyrin repeat protein
MSKKSVDRKPAKQASFLYTFFYPNSAARYNEEQRKLKRKEDDIKLHKLYKLIFDIEKHDFFEACRTVMNDRDRAKTKNADEFLPLHLCLYERGTLQLMELLIDSYPHALQERDPKGLLPVMIAARDNTVIVPILRMLCDCYAPALREMDPDGDLPVHSAIRYHLPKENIYELLNPFKEAIDIADKQGNTLLHLALRFQAQDELIEELVNRKPELIRIKNQKGDLPFHRACLFHASPAILKLLLSKYPESISEKDAQGNLPLHLYYMQCRGGRPSEAMLHFFLEPFPGSVGMKNKANTTPIEVLDKYYEQLEAYRY